MPLLGAAAWAGGLAASHPVAGLVAAARVRARPRRRGPAWPAGPARGPHRGGLRSSWRSPSPASGRGPPGPGARQPGRRAGPRRGGRPGGGHGDDRPAARSRGASGDRSWSASRCTGSTGRGAAWRLATPVLVIGRRRLARPAARRHRPGHRAARRRPTARTWPRCWWPGVPPRWWPGPTSGGRGPTRCARALRESVAGRPAEQRALVPGARRRRRRRARSRARRRTSAPPGSPTCSRSRGPT